MGFKEKYLKSGKYPYFIAEIGINHNGQMDLAKRMIDASKDAGADAVKFQKRNFDTLLLPGTVIPKPTGYLSKDENDLPTEEKAFGTWTYPDKRLEFTDEQVLQLWKYAESKDLDFIMSPWEEHSVNFLADYNVKSKYDMIIIDNVLEHFVDPKAVMLKVKGLLARGGRVYIAIPNRFAKRDTIRDIFSGHMTMFSSASLELMLNSVGLAFDQLPIYIDGGMHFKVKHMRNCKCVPTDLSSD